jgi:hypothetical protein
MKLYIICSALLLASSAMGQLKKTDSSILVKKYTAKLQIDNSKAVKLYKMQHAFADSMGRAFADTSRNHAKRSKRMNTLLAERYVSLASILTPMQLQQLPGLDGPQPSDSLVYRWKVRRDSLAARFEKIKNGPLPTSNAH